MFFNEIAIKDPDKIPKKRGKVIKKLAVSFSS
jgi:hypothetical protein